MAAFNIDAVFDIGANKGQFGNDLRLGGYKGKIVSFEPGLAAHSVLNNESNSDSMWHVHSRCALGDRAGEMELNVSSNSVSSSLLPMLDAHRGAAPDSVYMGREIVPVITLDSIFSNYVSGESNPFLKIDTQGYEWQVLNGAIETIPKVRGIQMELSLVPLYEGQKLWMESIERLGSMGFNLWAFEPVFVDHRDGRTLQVDATFFRG
jgi:FkbM family methyltransferase